MCWLSRSERFRSQGSQMKLPTRWVPLAAAQADLLATYSYSSLPGDFPALECFTTRPENAGRLARLSLQ